MIKPSEINSENLLGQLFQLSDHSKEENEQLVQVVMARIHRQRWLRDALMFISLVICTTFLLNQFANLLQVLSAELTLALNAQMQLNPPVLSSLLYFLSLACTGLFLTFVADGIQD